MSRRSDGSYLKRVLVIDLEATCFSGRPPEGQRSEIIEIGNAVLYTEDLRIEAGPEILVRPTVSAVSAFCTELTSLTQEDVDRRGVSLEEGLARLAAATRSAEHDLGQLRRVRPHQAGRGMPGARTGLPAEPDAYQHQASGCAGRGVAA